MNKNKKGTTQAGADSGHWVCQRPGLVLHEGLETGERYRESTDGGGFEEVGNSVELSGSCLSTQERRPIAA